MLSGASWQEYYQQDLTLFTDGAIFFKKLDELVNQFGESLVKKWGDFLDITKVIVKMFLKKISVIAIENSIVA